ncbi:cytochrome p450 [Moniliophthora roreri MCA 2997]|uniref:Cytochrome p450 n=2 Tax=Moniliophthora roreri TaxID=221103 RepID=V2WWJ8_MONRO|nr:cytochrome p450 [Moniliophthora roreri MCA 2997]KAI3599101.1 cytochrome p450 [Moniliophthora roreri]
MILNVLVYSLGLSFLYGIYLLVRHLWEELVASPLKDLPGPPSDSMIWGNLQQIFKAENSVLHEQWVEEYGPTIRYRAFFGFNRLYTTDTKALNHVLMNHYVYQKPEMSRWGLSQVLGDGILVMEEDKHKFQRKVMNPAFGPAQIRQLTSIFIEKSNELRDVWKSQVSEAENGEARLDALSWLSRMTLDVIGLAGFNYTFSSLSGKPSELNEAFTELFVQTSRITLWPVLQGRLPILRRVQLNTARDRAMKSSRKTMFRIAGQLLRDAKANQASEKATDKDLLSLLIRSNMQEQNEKSGGLSDEDVLAQVPTFLVAGHETTSTATTWALYLLTLHPEIQSKVREELLSVSTSEPTMDELNALPYLDKFVREVLRLYPPVPSTTRVAVKDDIIPLDEGYIGKDGKTKNHVRVKKGQTVFINIQAINRSKKIWGEDAHEFKPDRWDDLPSTVAASNVPGVWSHMLTFLGGARSCIGWRFSLVEMKCLVFVLVRAFEFELGVHKDEMGRKGAVIQRPMLKSDPEKRAQLPLIVRCVA